MKPAPDMPTQPVDDLPVHTAAEETAEPVADPVHQPGAPFADAAPKVPTLTGAARARHLMDLPAVVPAMVVREADSLVVRVLLEIVGSSARNGDPKEIVAGVSMNVVDGLHDAHAEPEVAQAAHEEADDATALTAGEHPPARDGALPAGPVAAKAGPSTPPATTDPDDPEVIETRLRAAPPRMIFPEGGLGPGGGARRCSSATGTRASSTRSGRSSDSFGPRASGWIPCSRCAPHRPSTPGPPEWPKPNRSSRQTRPSSACGWPASTIP